MRFGPNGQSEVVRASPLPSESHGSHTPRRCALRKPLSISVGWPAHAPTPRSIVLMLIASTVRTYVPAPSLDGRGGTSFLECLLAQTRDSTVSSPLRLFGLVHSGCGAWGCPFGPIGMHLTIHPHRWGNPFSCVPARSGWSPNPRWHSTPWACSRCASILSCPVRCVMRAWTWVAWASSTCWLIA